jgi:hypothetical protein
MVVHTSGAATVSVLTTAEEAGALVGSFHPLQTFADADQASSLPGTTFVLEGEVGARVPEEDGKTWWRYLDPFGRQDAISRGRGRDDNYTVTLMHRRGDVARRRGTRGCVGGASPARGTVRNIRWRSTALPDGARSARRCRSGTPRDSGEACSRAPRYLSRAGPAGHSCGPSQGYSSTSSGRASAAGPGEPGGWSARVAG